MQEAEGLRSTKEKFVFLVFSKAFEWVCAAHAGHTHVVYVMAGLVSTSRISSQPQFQSDTQTLIWPPRPHSNTVTMH